MNKNICQFLIIGLSTILVGCNSGNSSKSNNNLSNTMGSSSLSSANSNSVGNSDYPIIIGDKVVGKFVNNQFITSYVGNNTRAISYNDNKFIAVGSDIYNEKIAISTSSDNGVTWREEMTPKLNGSLNDIKYANNIFVTVGDNGVILTSTDGKKWSQEYSVVQTRLTSITYAENEFVVVGSNGVILTSPDAKTWVQKSSQANVDLLEISYGNGSFVAVGALNNDRQATILTSRDKGVTWQEQNSRVTAQLLGITYSLSTYQFIAVGNTFIPDAGVILTSPDGITWTQQLSNNNNLDKVFSFNKQIFALGDNGEVLTSTDGQSWAHVKSGSTSFLTGIAYGSNDYVLVGLNGETLTSTDGNEWTDVYSDLGASVIHVNNQYIAVGGNIGNNATISTSSDGVHWDTQSSKLSPDLTSITYDEDHKQYVAVGVGGAIITSPDAKNWTSQNSNVQADLLGVIYAKNKYVVTGKDLGSLNGVILTSKNGVKWTQLAYKVTQNKLLKTVIYANNKYVAIGGNLKTNKIAILNSRDGVSWQDVNVKIFGDLTGITYANNEFVAVGVGGVIITSTDGITWKPQTSGVNISFYNISYSNGKFLAVGQYGTILTSSDGISWDKIDSNVNNSLYGTSSSI